MSESCHRGHKCMCFQCGENDCEKYQSEPPEWFEKVYKMLKEKEVAEVLAKLQKSSQR